MVNLCTIVNLFFHPVGQPQTFTKMPEGAEEMPAKPTAAQFAAAAASREAFLKPDVDPRINPMDANSLFQVSYFFIKCILKHGFIDSVVSSSSYFDFCCFSRHSKFFIKICCKHFSVENGQK